MATMRVPDPQEPPSETHGSEAPEPRCALKTRLGSASSSVLVGRGGEGGRNRHRMEGKESWGVKMLWIYGYNFAPIFPTRKNRCKCGVYYFHMILPSRKDLWWGSCLCDIETCEEMWPKRGHAKSPSSTFVPNQHRWQTHENGQSLWKIHGKPWNEDTWWYMSENCLPQNFWDQDPMGLLFKSIGSSFVSREIL